MLSFELLLLQFIFSPIFIGVFLSTLMTLEGKSSQVVPKLQQVVLMELYISPLKPNGMIVFTFVYKLFCVNMMYLLL